MGDLVICHYVNVAGPGEISDEMLQKNSVGRRGCGTHAATLRRLYLDENVTLCHAGNEYVTLWY